MKKYVFLLTLMFLTGCLFFVEVKPIDKVYNFPPNSNLSIKIPYGEWSISGWGNNKAKITILRNSDPEEDSIYADFKLKYEKNSLIITPNFKNNLKKTVRIKGEIFVPFETNLSVSIDDGNLTLKSLKGEIAVNGESKKVKLDDVSGQVSVNLKKGLIEAFIFSFEKEDHYLLSVSKGNIKFFAPERAEFHLECKSKKAFKNYPFKSGKTKVILTAEKGEIIVDRIR